MEQWLIDGSGVSKYDTEEQELFLYQHMRTKGGVIYHLKEHLQLLDSTSVKLFGQPSALTERAINESCKNLITRGGYSETATHIIELRLWQSGRYQLRVIETSLYKEFSLRVMRPKAMVAEGCNYPFSQPTSAALAMVNFMRQTALTEQCQIAICTGENRTVLSVDGATPIAIHGTEITIGESVTSVYSNIVTAVLKQLPNHTTTIRPICLSELERADELFYADARGITAVGSLGDIHYSDSVAYAVSKKIVLKK